LLQALSDEQVELVVVGRVAAIIEGAPVTSPDLEVAVHPSENNLSRVAAALNALSAHSRDGARPGSTPDVAQLSATDTHPLHTTLGPLTLHTQRVAGVTFQQLLTAATTHSLGPLQVQVLGLDMVIEIMTREEGKVDEELLGLLHKTLAMKSTPGA